MKLKGRLKNMKLNNEEVSELIQTIRTKQEYKEANSTQEKEAKKLIKEIEKRINESVK